MTRDIEKEKQDQLARILAFNNTKFLFDQTYTLILHVREGATSKTFLSSRQSFSCLPGSFLADASDHTGASCPPQPGDVAQ